MVPRQFFPQSFGAGAGILCVVAQYPVYISGSGANQLHQRIG